MSKEVNPQLRVALNVVEREAMLTILPIRYVVNVDTSRSFYEGLGLRFDDNASFSMLAELKGDGGIVGIHHAAASKGRKPGAVDLCFIMDEKLEDVTARLKAKGYRCEIHDEDFGRSIRLTDPDGAEIQIQELDREKAKGSAAARPNDR